MKDFKRVLKIIVVLCLVEIVVLMFTISWGLEFGFKLWNWLIIGICVFVYVIFSSVIIIKEKKVIKKVDKTQLVVSEFYQDQASLVLKKLDSYLNNNQKVYNNLRFFWPLYKSLLIRISKGKNFIIKIIK